MNYICWTKRTITCFDLSSFSIPLRSATKYVWIWSCSLAKAKSCGFSFNSTPSPSALPVIARDQSTVGMVFALAVDDLAIAFYDDDDDDNDDDDEYDKGCN